MLQRIRKKAIYIIPAIYEAESGRMALSGWKNTAGLSVLKKPGNGITVAN